MPAVAQRVKACARRAEKGQRLEKGRERIEPEMRADPGQTDRQGQALGRRAAEEMREGKREAENGEAERGAVDDGVGARISRQAAPAAPSASSPKSIVSRPTSAVTAPPRSSQRLTLARGRLERGVIAHGGPDRERAKTRMLGARRRVKRPKAARTAARPIRGFVVSARRITCRSDPSPEAPAHIRNTQHGNTQSEIP